MQGSTGPEAALFRPAGARATIGWEHWLLTAPSCTLCKCPQRLGPPLSSLLHTPQARWSPADGAVWKVLETLGGGSLLEEVDHWGMGEVPLKVIAIPSSFPADFAACSPQGELSLTAT